MSHPHYVGTLQRSFKQAVIHLLETDYGLLGSGRVLSLLADDLQQLADQFHPLADHLQSGWLVFTGTKASGSKPHPGQSGGDHQLVTLAWPVLLPEDIQALADLPSGHEGRTTRSQLTRKRLVRLIEYGWQHPQGPVLLTTTDLGLMVGLTQSQVGGLLAQARQETGQALPTKGYYFDQGMAPSHKAEVVALYEQGLDEANIARQTQHSPSSVGRYLRDYERVKVLMRRQVTTEEIAPLIGLQPGVVKAYVELIAKYHPELIPKSELTPAGA
jgi:Protein of unknown function (DUF1670)